MSRVPSALLRKAHRLGWLLLPLLGWLGAACTVPLPPGALPPGGSASAPTATPIPPATVLPGPSVSPSALPESQAPASTPTGTPCTNMAAAAPRLDITVPDGTVLSPGQPFTKIWRLVNAGTCTWTPDYAVVWFSGARLGAPPALPLTTTVPPGQTVDIAVDMLAPTRAGTYTSYWKLRTPQGQLFGIGPGEGAPFWVRIVVWAPPTATATPTASPSPVPRRPTTPTATATFTPTATPSPTPQVQGTLSLALGAQVDLDTLAAGGSQADIGYAKDAQGAHLLRPLHGAGLGIYGPNPPTPEQCAHSRLASVPIPLEPLNPGTYLCYRTDQGRLGRLRYLNLEGDTLSLEATTWPSPP